MGKVRIRCARCHRRARLPGQSYCLHCMGLFRKARIKRLDAAGLCRTCGIRPRAPGRKNCKECLQHAKEYNKGCAERKKEREARKAEFEKLCEGAAEVKKLVWQCAARR